MSLKTLTNWLNSALVAGHEVAVVPLVVDGVPRQVDRADDHHVLGLAGLGERVELRVQVAVLVGEGPAALLALVDEALGEPVGAEHRPHPLHRVRVLVVVEEHLDLHATLVRRDQRVGDPDPVEGVDRDADRLALGHVADGVDDPALDLEAVGVHVGVVEEGTLVGLPALRLRLLLVSRRPHRTRRCRRGGAGARCGRAGAVACAEGALPHRVRTSAIETAQDPAIETLFTDNLSK